MQEYQIYRTSLLTGKCHNRIIRMDHADYMAYCNNEKLIQDALPYLSTDEREFIMSGITAEEFTSAFGEKEL